MKRRTRGVTVLATAGLLTLALTLLGSRDWTAGGSETLQVHAAKVGVHPNLFIDADEITAVRAQVADRQEPWATGYAQMISAAEAALELPPQSVVGRGRRPESGQPHDYFTDPPYAGTGDGIINPLNDRTDYRSAIAFAHAVRDLGLGYAFTGEARYADKAISLIQTWMIRPATRMTPAFTNQQSRIELSITMPAAFYGLDLVWTYPGWAAEDRQQAAAWARALGEDAQSWAGESSNNFENWRLVLVAAAGAVAGDADLLERALAEWQQLIEVQMDPQGRLTFELDRTRSLSYSSYALKAMTLTAEIARHQQVDLYGYALADGRGLKLALDFHAPYVAAPGAWPWQQISDYKGEEASFYELAFSFADTPAYRNVLQTYGRPLRDNRVLGPITLTHARGAYPFAPAD